MRRCGSPPGLRQGEVLRERATEALASVQRKVPPPCAQTRCARFFVLSMVRFGQPGFLTRCVSIAIVRTMTLCERPQVAKAERAAELQRLAATPYALRSGAAGAASGTAGEAPAPDEPDVRDCMWKEPVEGVDFL